MLPVASSLAAASGAERVMASSKDRLYFGFLSPPPLPQAKPTNLAGFCVFSASEKRNSSSGSSSGSKSQQ